ncbi:hypothetical protein [Actinocrispum sp. NPDC049592]|uniref:hypothetical protein n=1 Tax=Actinocrispum sp. NPDC049592 TaxID=3154835 RepID=UPI0034136618
MAGPSDLRRRNIVSGLVLGLTFGFAVGMAAWYLITLDNGFPVGGLTGAEIGVLTGLIYQFRHATPRDRLASPR